MPFFISSRISDNLWMTICLVAAFVTCRVVLEFVLTRGVDALTQRRRRFCVRTTLNTLIAVALMAVWLSEIQNLILSLTAVLVAMVIAVKELIMCAAGAVLRFGGHLFKVGDRIELAGIHGEVIDHGLFSTTIMELPSAHLGHAGTGRTVMLPNSILLSGPVRVEAQPRHFAPHRFTLTFENGVPARRTLQRIERVAAEVLAPDSERASRFHRMTAGRAGAEIDGPGFAVSAATSELGKLQFHVMIYCLVRDARDLEQTITLAVLDEGEAEVAATDRRVSPLGASAKEVLAWEEIGRQLKEGVRSRRAAAS